MSPAAPSVCLVVLDGWGLAQPGPGNAVSLARTPAFDELWERYPHTTLTACGPAVGLPEGQMGNSEVGHLNLGAGAIVKQDLVRIDDAVRGGTLAENPVLREAFAGGGRGARASGGDGGGAQGGALGADARSERGAPATAPRRVHLLGLVSDGGVHSSLDHLLALVELGGRLAPDADLVVHAFTDGRDTLPHAGASYLARVDATPARVGSVVGRYWAMDRDRRWDRTQRAYDMLVHGRAPHRADSGEQAVRDAYERGETDEFIEPTLVGEQARIRPGDSVICFNFRPDRMRQLVRALAEPGFGEGEMAAEPTGEGAGAAEPSGVWEGAAQLPGGGAGAAEPSGVGGGAAEPPVEVGGRGAELPGWEGRRGAPPVTRLATLTEYEEGWPYPVAFAPARPRTTLAETVARTGAKQLHVAETEKYPHVTYFFNGGEETACEGERRELVPSPRDVPTYDHKPQMSAREAAAAFVRAWGEEQPRFAIINFANADMVGHTGVIAAAVQAIETVDECLGEVLAAVSAGGGVCVVTADHGNADHMLEPDGSPNTAHSLNPVPLVVTREGLSLREGGILADVAPTVLALLGIAQPPEMTGRSLIQPRE